VEALVVIDANVGEAVTLLGRSKSDGPTRAANIPWRSKSPRSASRADVGTGKSHDEVAPLTDIIGVLNERFGTEF